MKFLASLLGWSKPPENRMELRLPSHGRLRLTWHDKRGNRRSARARVLDMNGSGALVRTGASIIPGSHVYVYFTDMGLSGGAMVRRAEPGLVTYRLALQFSGPLTFLQFSR